MSDDDSTTIPMVPDHDTLREYGVISSDTITSESAMEGDGRKMCPGCGDYPLPGVDEGDCSEGMCPCGHRFLYCQGEWEFYGYDTDSDRQIYEGFSAVAVHEWDWVPASYCDCPECRADTFDHDHSVAPTGAEVEVYQPSDDELHDPTPNPSPDTRQILDDRYGSHDWQRDSGKWRYTVDLTIVRLHFVEVEGGIRVNLETCCRVGRVRRNPFDDIQSACDAADAAVREVLDEVREAIE